MRATVDLLDLAYVGALLGSMVPLGLLWHSLPWLLGKETGGAAAPIGASPRPASGFGKRIAAVLSPP